MKVCNIKNVLPNVYLLEFPNQFELTTTLIRFQERYENPKFKGKIFDVDDIQDWWYEEFGEFDYYNSVVGFNFSSENVKAFMDDGRLRKKEEKFVKHFMRETGRSFSVPFYIIGVFKGKKSEGNVNESSYALRHEMSHGLFNTNKDYRFDALKILKEYRKEVKVLYKMFKHMDYHKSLWDDECQAYLMENDIELRTRFRDYLTPKNIKWNGALEKIEEPRKKMRNIFKKYMSKTLR